MRAELADGTVLEFPDGTDPAVVDRVVKSHISGGQSQERPNDLWGGGSQFASGLLQGLGDEIKAGTAAAKEWASGRMGFGEAYDQALPQYQRARSRYEKENPVLAPTLDIAGQTLPWLAATPLLPALAAGASMAQKMATGAKIGAPIGAVSGALNAEGGAVDRLQGAGVGATAGGVLGGIAPPVIEGAIGLVKGAVNQIVSRLPFQQRAMAARKIAEALARDGITPEQAAARLREMGSESALLDMGPNTRALAGAAQQTPGEGKTAITNFLVNRQEGVRDANKVIQGGQINRITDQINNLVPENYADTQAGIIAAKKGFGRSYNAARDGGDLVDVLPLINSLDDEISVSKGGIKSGLQKVKDLLVDEQGRPEITIESLHQAKMAIDDLMSGEGRTSMGNVAKGKIRDFQNGLISAIESSGESGAAYNAGRVGTRGEWMKQDALERGAKFMSKSEFINPESLSADLAKMSPEELHTFRIGAAQALKQKVGDLVTRADATKKIMDIPSLEKKIRFAFGDDDLFKRYITGLESEKEMFKGYSMMGGSQTAEREAAKADAAIDPSRIIRGLVRFKSPNPLDWAGGMVDVLGGAKDRALMSGGLSKSLGDALTGKDAASLAQAYRMGEITDASKRQMIKALSTAAGSFGGQPTMQDILGAR